MITREPGYYWVKDKRGNEKIAELVSEGEEPVWIQMGSRLEITGDQHWKEINERRIERVPSPEPSQEEPDRKFEPWDELKYILEEEYGDEVDSDEVIGRLKNCFVLDRNPNQNSKP